MATISFSKKKKKKTTIARFLLENFIQIKKYIKKHKTIFLFFLSKQSWLITSRTVHRYNSKRYSTGVTILNFFDGSALPKRTWAASSDKPVLYKLNEVVTGFTTHMLVCILFYLLPCCCFYVVADARIG